MLKLEGKVKVSTSSVKSLICGKPV